MTESKKISPDGITRGGKEYCEGRAAFVEGESECPYVSGPARMNWWSGYLDRRTVARLGVEFDNWNGDVLWEKA